MRKILCATDKTEVSRKGEMFAVEIAKALQAELGFIYVTPMTESERSGPHGPSTVILEAIEARQFEVLAHAEKVAQDSGIPNVRCVAVRSLDISRAIVEHAESEGYDHIVTGSTGRVGIPRFFLGSVANNIIHHAHCPVTVVR